MQRTAERDAVIARGFSRGTRVMGHERDTRAGTRRPFGEAGGVVEHLRGLRQVGVPAASLTSFRIVVLDDDEDNVVLLDRLLRSAGYTDVEGRTDPVSACEELATHPPDLLLLDLHMPEVDGFAILERLAHHVAGPAPLPVIVLSADLAPQVKRRALAAGARDFLTKPYDLIEVLLRVGNLLETRFLHLRVEQQKQVLEEDEQRRADDLERIAVELAHELRTPLFSIRGLAEVLLHFEDDVPPRLRKDIATIDAVAQEALEVVNRQIAAARSAAGRTPMLPGPVDVEALLTGLRAMMQPLARAQNIELSVASGAGLPALHTDGVALAQVLRNLAANAIRHTYAGRVSVTARIVEGGHRMAFDVADTGIGIHEAVHERIFEDFERLGNAADPPDGGIGLPLARRLARRLGGEVSLVSAPKRGSTFTATVAVGLPAAGPVLLTG